MENNSLSVSYVWHRILSRLEDQMGVVTVAAWFDQTEVVCVEGKKLLLKESSAFRREIISQKLVVLIQEIGREEFGIDIEAVFEGDLK